MKTARRLLFLLGLAVLLLPAGGCGGGCNNCNEVDDYWGNVYVSNRTHLTTWEWVVFFEVAVVGGPWTGDLLTSDVPPGGIQFVGSFSEDYYDAYAELEFGDWVEWYDIFVGYGHNSFFEVY